MRNIRPHHVISTLAVGGLAFMAFTSPQGGEPLLTDLSQFVLVAEEKVHLADNVQVSSGDIAANKEINISSSNIVNANLFSDQIKIAENTQVNGNATFNSIKIANGSEILGGQISPVSLPIIDLPDVADFTAGTQNLVIQEDQTITPGSYNKVEVKPATTLTLTPGTYNLNELDLRENSHLIFSGLTTLNIKENLKVSQKVLIAPKDQAQPKDLGINTPTNKPVTVGETSFISFKLVAPNARINLGDRITFRGQVIGKEVQVGEDSVLSDNISLVKDATPEDILEDEDGSKYVISEVVVNFTDEATISDAQQIADLIQGRIVGFLESTNTYQIETAVTSPEELNNKIQTIRQLNHPLVEGVFRNYVLGIE